MSNMCSFPVYIINIYCAKSRESVFSVKHICLPFIFQCKCCKIVESAGGEIPSSMPDLSALYKLHLECGKLINLCDWLEVNFNSFY